MYDIIIIGAGPAGLTAALYASRAMKKILVLEAVSYGGQIINSSMVDNYPAIPHTDGYDFATRLYNQVKELKVDIKFERVIEIIDQDKYKLIKTKDNTYESKTIIIATGNSSRKLGIDKEEELVGRGVSYCATCDGAFFKNKDVAVIGGGNTALEDAIYLSNIASHVYIIHRNDAFKAEDVLIKTIKEKNNIECIYNSNITKLNGEEKLESIEITNNDGTIKTINVSGIFIAIGRVPENEIFKNIITLDDSGYILAGENCHTNIQGIFVAGDARHKELRQLVTATSDGAIAATEAIKYLDNDKM
ncbi:MAG: thioredoxin-disulfide reductase [Bacilli bacterium]|nr:thioredoxin-disulfide reductase [Bacilli bacterium]